jgi:hypothetical protein
MDIGPHKSIRPRIWSGRSGPSWIQLDRSATITALVQPTKPADAMADEQIFGADEQVPGRRAKRLRSGTADEPGADRMSELWYYAEGGESRGPLSLADLVANLSQASDPEIFTARDGRGRKTIGIVSVAAFAARTEGVVGATITFTCG